MFNIYATDYAPVDPIIPPCDITPIFIGYKGENKARCLIFDLTECVETFGDGGFVISFIRQGDDLPYLVTDTDRLDNNAIWIITDTDTAVDGYGMVQLQYIVDDVVCKSALYRTVTFDSNSITGDVPDPYEDLLAQIAAYAAQAEGAATTATAAAATATTAVEEGIKTERSQRIAADEGLNTRINELMGLAGAPSMANSAAAMTDSSKIYVYTGSEAGYLTGHWYYYNGTEWADGGVYQATAINTDKTLTVENMAADAAVVGEKIDECMAAFVIDSVSGNIASFTDGADNVPLKGLVVNIVPKQASGTPSPDNVLPITGWTESNIYRRGANIWDEGWEVGAYNGSNGTKASSSDRIRSNGLIPVTPDTTYYRTKGLQVYFYDVNKRYISWQALGGAGTFTTPSNAHYMTFNGMANSGATYNYDISINYPPTDTEYHAYNGNTYNISFSSAGTVYGGTLDVTSGMLTVTWKQSTINALTGWYYSSPFFSVPIPDITAVYGASSATIGFMSEQYKYKGQGVGWSSMPDYSYGLAGTSLRIKDTRYTTTTDFLANEGDKPIFYELANPVSHQLTPTEVKTLLGDNNIFADTGSVASCEYRADTKLYIEHLTDPDSDMVANANITSGSYFMVNNSLYLATANIANGGAITPGTNCTATNLAAALNAINS